MIALRRRLDPSVLRLVIVTDGVGDLERIADVVARATAAGARCVQLREPKWSARQLMRGCERIVPLLEAVDGIVLVNDRLDVAAARMAHGAQIGFKSLPPDIAREILGPGAVLGYSAHDQEELDLAAEAGCDFALLSPIWPTSSKPVPHLGEARAVRLTATARLPVVWLGGVHVRHAARVGQLTGYERPAGVAVRSAVMGAEDPGAAVRRLLRAVSDGLYIPPAVG
jgi:thiamine-phosphate diphosphorylase